MKEKLINKIISLTGVQRIIDKKVYDAMRHLETSINEIDNIDVYRKIVGDKFNRFDTGFTMGLEVAKNQLLRYMVFKNNLKNYPYKDFLEFEKKYKHLNEK